ncbi:MAG: N-6 DNA methylase [Lachnospiraceae bacterium]|nr:N-6 DNA methylase [Lachnospiraceae bacterium]
MVYTPNIFEKEWDILEKKLPDIQIFYIFQALILRSRIYSSQRQMERPSFTKENFCAAFSHIPEYDFKEILVRFAGKIEWKLIEEDQEIQRVLQYVEEFILQDERLGQRAESLNLILETAGNKGIYIMTPRSVNNLICELFHDVEVHRIADFCCGVSKLGIDIWQAVMVKAKEGSFCGIELDAVLGYISDMLLFLSGIENRQIIQRDILTPPIGQEEMFDFIVMDVPRGRNKSENYSPRDPRMKGFQGKKIYTDWIYIQDVLYHLNDHGYAAILATNGAVVRANERELREYIVKQDWLEAVITLPVNLYPNTRIGTELLIFHKRKEAKRKEKILFVDISSYYYRAKRNAYAISKEGICLAAEIFQNFKEVEGISTVKGAREIEQYNFSFKPLQYMQSSFREQNYVALQKIAEVYRGFQALNRNVTDEDGTVLFLNVKDIQNGFIDYESAEKMSTANPACKEKYRIREDDILITTKGTSIKICIVEEKPPEAYISGNITLIRVTKEQYHPEILYEYLNSQYGRKELERIQSGTTIKLINNSNLREMRVPLYRWEQQKSIGDALKSKKLIYLRQSRQLHIQYEENRMQLLNMLWENT